MSNYFFFSVLIIGHELIFGSLKEEKDPEQHFQKSHKEKVNADGNLHQSIFHACHVSIGPSVGSAVQMESRHVLKRIHLQKWYDIVYPHYV